MSRYYSIIITDPKSGKVIVPKGFDGLLGGATYTSYVNGKTLPEAWDVELDIPVIGAATPQGFGTVRVWGVSIDEISQAQNLNGKNISIYVGMQKGLPLANPAQAGLIAKGYIFQAFGFWEGEQQSLDLVIAPGSASGTDPGGPGTLATPKNIVLNWKAGTPLADALKTTLQTAFPGYPATVNISSNIVTPGDAPGFYPTLEQLAQYVRQVSRDIVKTKGYPGVSIVLDLDKINVFDNTATSSTGGAAAQPKQIAFTDLIGQPTWIQSPSIVFKTVMRSDIKVNDAVMLPPVVTTNTQNANSQIVNQRAAFQGGFNIISARHIGRSRQPSADAWVSVYEGVPRNNGTTTGGSGSP